MKDEAYLEQSKPLNKSTTDLEILNKRFIALDKKLSETEDQLSSKQLSVQKLKDDNEHLSDELNDFEKLFLKSASKKFYNSTDKFPPLIIEKVRELKREDLWNDFIDLGNFLEKGGAMSTAKMNSLIDKGVVFEHNSSNYLNTLGKIIWYYRHILKDTLPVYDEF